MSVAAVSQAGTTRARFRFGPLWLVAPGLVFLIIFFLVPVARLMGLSFENADTGAITGAHYTRIFDTDVYFRVLLITFRIAALTTMFSLLFGYPLAYWLSRLPERKRGMMILLVMVPFWTSYLVKSFAWVILLGRTGVINQLGLGSGVIGSPLEMLHNEFGVMIGMVHAMLPLAVLTMLPVMSGIDRRLTQASGTLGRIRPRVSGWFISRCPCRARLRPVSSPLFLPSASSLFPPFWADASRPCSRS